MNRNRMIAAAAAAIISAGLLTGITTAPALASETNCLVAYSGPSYTGTSQTVSPTSSQQSLEFKDISVKNECGAAVMLFDDNGVLQDTLPSWAENADINNTFYYYEVAYPTGISLWNDCSGWEVDWSPVPDAASYDVYGNGVLLASGLTTEDGEYMYQFSSPLNETYTVTAVYSDGTQSAPSASVSNPGGGEGC